MLRYFNITVILIYFVLLVKLTTVVYIRYINKQYQGYNKRHCSVGKGIPVAADRLINGCCEGSEWDGGGGRLWVCSASCKCKIPVISHFNPFFGIYIFLHSSISEIHPYKWVRRPFQWVLSVWVQSAGCLKNNNLSVSDYTYVCHPSGEDFTFQRCEGLSVNLL